jgi:hypothetical protein
VGGQCHARAALPPRKTRYPLYRRLGGPQGRSGQVRKFSFLPGFDTRTVQPVALIIIIIIPVIIIIIIIIIIIKPPSKRSTKQRHSTSQKSEDLN